VSEKEQGGERRGCTEEQQIRNNEGKKRQWRDRREAADLEGDRQEAAWEQHGGRGHWTPDTTPFAVRFEDDFASVVDVHVSDARWQGRREMRLWPESLASFKTLDKMVDNRSIVEQAHEIQCIAKELDHLKIVLPDRFVAGCIIAKLPSTWRNFATSLKHKR
jgi:hypothetical protein